MKLKHTIKIKILDNNKNNMIIDEIAPIMKKLKL